MYRGIAQPVRNLGEIQTLAADKLLGRVDFHVGEIVNNSAAAPLPEQLLHLRTADEIVTADLLNGKLTGQMIFQIGEQTFIYISICPGFMSGGHSLLPDEADEELLQIKLII